MIHLYRQPTQGEFYVFGGDCSQGGIDANVVQGISKDKIDVPIVLKQKGVAADMTPVLHQLLEWVYDKTGVQPVVALERNMGGASEMQRLRKLNRLNKYLIYTYKLIGNTSDRDTERLGWVTDATSRPRMVGDLKIAIDNMGLKIYDKETVDELASFIISKNNKPEAAPNAHDDHVMSLAVAWQLYQTENKITINEDDGDVSSGNMSSLIY